MTTVRRRSMAALAAMLWFYSFFALAAGAQDYPPTAPIEPPTPTAVVDDVGQAAEDTTGLPRTGSDTPIPMARIAVTAITVGGLLVLVAKRRRSAPPA